MNEVCAIVNIFYLRNEEQNLFQNPISVCHALGKLKYILILFSKLSFKIGKRKSAIDFCFYRYRNKFCFPFSNEIVKHCHVRTSFGTFSGIASQRSTRPDYLLYFTIYSKNCDRDRNLNCII